MDNQRYGPPCPGDDDYELPEPDKDLVKDLIEEVEKKEKDKTESKPKTTRKRRSKPKPKVKAKPKPPPKCPVCGFRKQMAPGYEVRCPNCSRLVKFVD